MAISIQFWGGHADSSIQNIGGSGMGFYGSGSFGASSPVGEYARNIYITDATGAVEGPKCKNVRYASSTTGEIAVGDVRNLRAIPNSLCPLNIRVISDTPVKLQNSKLRIFDRVNIDAPPSGVTCYAFEAVHPWETSSPNGSGGTTWSLLGGSGGTIGLVTYDAPLSLIDSPGTSGLRPSGSNTTDTRHDHYIGLSACTQSIGSKTQFGLMYITEYI